MTDQTILIPEPPKLTAQQRIVHDALTHAATQGITAQQAGALAHSIMESRWRHEPNERCEWCASRGTQILKALRAKGLAKYRSKLKVWQAVGAGETAGPSSQDTGWDNLLKAGF